MPSLLGAPQIERAIIRAGGLWKLRDIAHFTGTKRARAWPQEHPDFPRPGYVNAQKHRFYCGYEVRDWLERTDRLAQARRMDDWIIRWLARVGAPGKPRSPVVPTD